MYNIAEGGKIRCKEELKKQKVIRVLFGLMSGNRPYTFRIARRDGGYKTNRMAVSFHSLPALGAAQVGKGGRP